MSVLGDQVVASRFAAFLAPAALVGVVVALAPAEAPEVAPVPVAGALESGPRAEPVARRAGLSGEGASAYDAEVKRLAGLGRVAAPFPVEADRSAEPEVESGPSEPEAPAMALTSVMAGMRGGVCIINGAALGVGDSAAPGWEIVEIDAHARRVVVEGPGGSTVTLVQRVPGE